ncbi:NAD(P)-binding protein [Exidia glandulosa HHB12029]|uniref:NAD(P)-binding protein n=1 Tax=Exidia glandulosa HHB12029 TaxID=1314781 RepID=A0A165DGY6_EXIGL|nr:NAD(P)-binding protein [Exidia glandulosa HHB12029]
MGGILSILIQYFPPRAKWSVDEIGNLSGNVYLVTGASSGIGKACATTLAAKGGKVYVACRSESTANDVVQQLKAASGSQDVHYLLLDLSSLKSVEQAAAHFLRQETELHVLFNNGGVMTPPEVLTPQGLDTTFATNVLGAFQLTNLLLPALLAGAKSSPDGTARVVNTSSSTAELATLDYQSLIGKKQRSAHALYAQSKLGIAIFARELARRYGDQGIVSTSVHPGSINTELFRTQPTIVQWLMRLLLYSPEKGALTLLYCGVALETKLSNGKYFIPWARPGKSWQPQPSVEDPAVGKKLWEWLEDRVNDIKTTTS